MNVQLAIGSDAHQTVVPAAAGRVKRLADADARDLRSASLAAARFALLPVESGCAALDRLALISARDRALRAVVLRLVVGRIDAAQLHPIDTERVRCFVEQRLDCAGDLILARSALGAG